LSLLTPDNCVVAIVDLQPQIIFFIVNFDRQSIINNDLVLSKAARVFDVPVVLSTVETKGRERGDEPRTSARRAQGPYRSAGGRFRSLESGDVAVQFVTQSVAIATPDAVLEDDRLSSVGRRFAEAAAFVQAYPHDLPRLKTLLPGITTHVLVLAGMQDPVDGESMFKRRSGSETAHDSVAASAPAGGRRSGAVCA
jgi:hypothetical protein